MGVGPVGAELAGAGGCSFCALTFAGLALSTLAVGAAASWVDAAPVSALRPRAVVVGAADVAAFGSIWVEQFLILEPVLFRRPGHDDPTAVASPPDDNPPSPTEEVVRHDDPTPAASPAATCAPGLSEITCPPVRGDAGVDVAGRA